MAVSPSVRIPKLAVFGDIILDKYSHGSVERISPEAPIPVLLVEREVYKPGGAGNTAANLAALGARVDLLGVVGDDPYRPLLLDAIGSFGIRCKLISDRNRHTIVKQRLISASQQLLRVDYEVSLPLDGPHVEALLENFDPPYDAIIVSDYAKGAVCPALMEFLKAQPFPIFVDPKPQNAHLYHGVHVVKPNAKECIQMSGASDPVKGAELLSRRLDTAILLTLGKGGVAYVEKGSRDPIIVETKAKDVIDVTGAGDTVIATFVFFRSLGYSAREALRLANEAAGLVVTKVGCYQVTLDDLKPHLR